MLRNSLLVNLFIGLLLTLAMTVVWFNIDRLGQPEELLPLIRPYFLLQLTSWYSSCYSILSSNLADGITDTKTPMYIMISANLVNIAEIIY
ncbi:MAG: MATE family efflux transporter [Odoribacter splanchnicus]